MNKKMWIVASLAAAVAVLAAASYVAISLVFSGSAGLGASGTEARHGYQVIQPTEVPPTLPDEVGPVIAIKDQSFTVQSHSKAVTNQGGPTTEIVIAADTRVYQDITARENASIVDGKLQMRVAPYAYTQIKIGDVLSVWGSLRGGRLAAEAVIVQVSSPATPAP